ncbi:MAG: DUF2752 domain-containing protein [Pedobacter sp.]|nr:MAG: DUF2752 domain-containing protein [Pedobacter sp.]
MKRLSHTPVELLFWVAALLMLAIAEPELPSQAHHFTICPLANLGISWCPGCGIGRSITQLLHGNLEESFAHHWFGVPALIIISTRVWSLSKLQLKLKKIII